MPKSTDHNAAFNAGVALRSVEHAHDVLQRPRRSGSGPSLAFHASHELPQVVSGPRLAGQVRRTFSIHALRDGGVAQPPRRVGCAPEHSSRPLWRLCQPSTLATGGATARNVHGDRTLCRPSTPAREELLGADTRVTDPIAQVTIAASALRPPEVHVEQNGILSAAQSFHLFQRLTDQLGAAVRLQFQERLFVDGVNPMVK